MKKELHNYLEKYFEYWKKERGTFPMVPYDEDLSTEMYLGEVDEDEYIQWRYMENNTIIDFNSIEVTNYK